MNTNESNTPFTIRVIRVRVIRQFRQYEALRIEGGRVLATAQPQLVWGHLVPPV